MSRRFQFSLWQFMVVVTVAAVVLGAVVIAPGLWISFVIAGIAGIRAMVVGWRRQKRDVSLTAFQRLGLLVTSLMVVTLVGLASFIAFFTTCLATGFVTDGDPIFGNTGYELPMSTAVAVLVACFLLWWTRPK